MIEGGTGSARERGEAPEPSEVSSDPELVQFFRDGKDAEARLAGPAVPADAQDALRAIRDRGLLAWQVLFLRYQSTVRAFAMSRVRSVSVEEFEAEFFDRFWAQHKARTWRGDASFKTWIRRAAASIHSDLLDEVRKLSDADRKALDESSAGQITPAGGRGPTAVDADPEAHPDDLASAESDEADQEIPDDAAPLPVERRAEWADSSGQEPGGARQRLTRTTASMPPDRRLVYRLSHALPLADDDIARIAARCGMDRAQVEVELRRLYDDFQDRSDARVTRLGARRERARIRSVKTQERLRECRRTWDELARAKESTRGPQPGLDASLARAHRDVGAVLVRLRTLEARIEKLDAALREALRIGSNAVARLLATSANNVDKHLQRARETIARAGNAREE